MIDNRNTSIVVYDNEHNEIFSLACPIDGSSMLDLHGQEPTALFAREELRQIAEAIIIFTNHAHIWL